MRSNVNPIAKLESDQKSYEAKISKMEAEMQSVFALKVKEKEGKSKEAEEKYAAKERDLRRQLENAKRELAERQSAFEEEKRQAETQAATTTKKKKTTFIS